VAFWRLVFPDIDETSEGLENSLPLTVAFFGFYRGIHPGTGDHAGVAESAEPVGPATLARFLAEIRIGPEQTLRLRKLEASLVVADVASFRAAILTGIKRSAGSNKQTVRPWHTSSIGPALVWRRAECSIPEHQGISQYLPKEIVPKTRSLSQGSQVHFY